MEIIVQYVPYNVVLYTYSCAMFNTFIFSF